MAETRAEALQWCKDRALAYVDQSNVIAHLGMPLLMAGLLDTPKQMRDWIEGFH